MEEKSLFLRIVDDEFICAICLDILKNPTSACSQTHLYCNECIRTVLETTKSCPTCREPISAAKLVGNRPIQNLIAKGIKFSSHADLVAKKVASINQVRVKWDCEWPLAAGTTEVYSKNVDVGPYKVSLKMIVGQDADVGYVGLFLYVSSQMDYYFPANIAQSSIALLHKMDQMDNSKSFDQNNFIPINGRGCGWTRFVSIDKIGDFMTLEGKIRIEAALTVNPPEVLNVSL
jgi:hypothetical protein